MTASLSFFESPHMTPPTPSADHTHSHNPALGHATPTGQRVAQTRSVLAWPAWLRVAAVLPLLLALWLAVGWANAGVSPW